MRKLIIVCILISGTIYGQNFQGRAIYKTHRKSTLKISSSSMSPAMQKKFEERLKKMNQKTFVLNFNQKESIYRQDKELGAPATATGGIQVLMVGSGDSDVLYKNIAKNTYSNQKEISGKRFLIKDSLKKNEWKMTGETKKIGNYTCYKATKSNEVTRKSFLSTDGKEEQTEKKETIVTTVWYTPQIPISNGPGMYGGLPGLILEVHAGNKTIVCSEIVLNPKEKVTIKKPTKGKKVTQKEYAKIMNEHTKEMLERYKPRKSKKGNKNSISIDFSN